jgi:hypothetical protein
MDRIFTQEKISTKKLNTTNNGKQNNLSHEPSDDIIFSILNYSKSLTVKPSELVNQVELVLN